MPKRCFVPVHDGLQPLRYGTEAKRSLACHIHSLRHTCASWLVMKGVPMQIVKEVLGLSVNVTEICSHLAPEAAMEKAFGS